jgi:hypothetical protein
MDLLRLMSANDILAVPVDKNLGLCLVTCDWYHDTGMKLLVNDSYVEAEPDHYMLIHTLRKVLEQGRTFITRQQYHWLNHLVLKSWIRSLS